MNLPGIINKEKCSGCGVCVEVCKKKALTMVPDIHGFLYPLLDTDKCIECSCCETNCPSINPPLPREEIGEACVAVHKDSNTILNSASGGAFCGIIDAWEKQFKKETFVCGVKWKEDFSVCHDVSIDRDSIKQFSKSKYLMSDTNGVFEKISRLVKSGALVLFSGTPCQNAALRNYIGRDYENLLQIDIVCHGAPSALLFQKSIRELEKKKVKKVKSWLFHDKTPINGVMSSRSASVKYHDGTTDHFKIMENSYLRLYYSRLAYRSSCAECIFATPQRVSDITICDAHHIDMLYPELSVENGTSIILFHTLKGLMLKDNLEKTMHLYPLKYDWAVEHNEQLRKPTDIHPKTRRFFALIDNGMSFEKTVNICLHRTILDKIVQKYKLFRNT